MFERHYGLRSWAVPLFTEDRERRIEDLCREAKRTFAGHYMGTDFYSCDGDGKCIWTIGEKKDSGRVYGVKRLDGKYDYEIRYDAGPKDLEMADAADRAHLTELLKTGKLQEKEPNVWYLREIDKAQNRDIGEWWGEIRAEDLRRYEEVKRTTDVKRWHLEHHWLEDKLKNAKRDYDEFIAREIAPRTLKYR